MTDHQDQDPCPSADLLVEGVARVVAIDAGGTWLEPEQGASCGGCTSMACGAKGLGTMASRLAARRFSLQGHPELRLGDRVVVGVRGDALLKAAGTAYAIPLCIMLAGGGMAQALAGRDSVTLAATVLGLVLGLGIARLMAARLAVRGITSPRLLRRLESGQSCRLS